MQANIKLIAADIDGTILAGDTKSLSARIRESIKKAMPETHVALITGRAYGEVAPILAQLGNPAIWLGLGGGTEVRDPSGKIVSEIEIAPGTVEQFRAHAKGYSSVNFLGRSGWVDSPKFESGTSVRAAVVAKLSFAEAEALQVECSQAFPELFVSVGTDIDLADRFVVFVQPKNATKGEALRIIQENLGVLVSETAAIGDMTLDVPMFERAYYSVAMGNAPEEVRKQARMVVGSVEQDGAAELFEMAFGSQARSIVESARKWTSDATTSSAR